VSQLFFLIALFVVVVSKLAALAEFIEMTDRLQGAWNPAKSHAGNIHHRSLRISPELQSHGR